MNTTHSILKHPRAAAHFIRPSARRLGLLLGLAFAHLLPLTLPLGAQTVPVLVNYQGRLANPDGSPLPTADYTLTFNIYDATTNGMLIWGPQVFDGVAAPGHGPRIPVVQGYFNVMLGPVDAAGSPRPLTDAFNGSTRFVEVTVSNRPPIAPRQQILTTPFAFQAANSAKLAGYDWSALFGTNNPVAGTIPFSKLAQRQVGTNVGIGGVAVSGLSGDQSFNTVGILFDVTNLTVTLTTTGRPVYIGLVGSTNNPAVESRFVYGYNSGGGGARGSVVFLQGTTIIDNSEFSLSASGNGKELKLPPSAFHTIATPTAGTCTYKVQGFLATGTVLEFYNVKLVAYEL